MARFRECAYAGVKREAAVAHNRRNSMKRRKFITLTSEADIEAACRWMDRRELDWPLEVGDGVVECDADERAMVLEARSGQLDEDW